MHLVEREFLATQPLNQQRKGQSAGVRLKTVRSLRKPPRTLFRTVVILARAEATFALLMPALCGAMLAWWQFGRLDTLGLCFTILGIVTMLWGFNALSEYYDYRHSLTTNVRNVHDPFFTGFGLMRRALIRPATVRDFGWILVAIGFLCSLWLVVLAGWPILFFSGMSFLIGCVIVLFPVRYGYHGWGLSELGVFVGFGLLQSSGSYYVQAHTLTWLPFWTGIPFGLFSALICFNYNAIHHRRDWLIHKRTLAVNLGLERTLDLSALLSLSGYVAILLIVSLVGLPLVALVGLAPLPIALGAFAHIQREHPTVTDYVYLYTASINAVVLTGILFGAALLMNKLF